MSSEVDHGGYMSDADLVFNALSASGEAPCGSDSSADTVTWVSASL